MFIQKTLIALYLSVGSCEKKAIIKWVVQVTDNKK